MTERDWATTPDAPDALPWRELAARNKHARDLHQRRADDAWHRLDITEAVRQRGIVAGLDLALTHQGSVVAEALQLTKPDDSTEDEADHVC